PKCAVASQESHGEQATEDQATIIIRPAEGAAYAFHDWRMEVDQPAVLDLLINRVYDSPYMFVRELIQNALDATRCQMYSDFKRENPNIDPPDRPTRFRPEFRERYPLNLSLKKKLVQTAADEPPENRLVFSIEDSGTGMTEEIIKRYFLQVGRSYYKSAEFRKRYGFIPTSRFGVGFLSTFAVSNHITVETAHSHLETGQPRGIRLTLREPKNYLLTEPWTPFEERPVAARSGTRIQVVLDTWPEDLTLVELVRRFCVAVEVPVVVDEDGSKTVVGQMLWHDGEVLGSSKVDPKGRFVVRAFAVDTAGVEGQIAVLAYADENGEGWCHCWSHDVGLDGKAIEEPPSLGAGFEALHGIRAGSSTIRDYSGTDRSRWLSRLDLRGDERMVSLSRVHPAEDEGWPIPSRHAFERGREGPSKLKAVVSEVAQAAISEHLGKSTRAKGPRGIYYVGQVLSDAPVDDTWREEFPGTVVTWQSGKRVDISVTELLALGEIVIPAWCIPNHSRGDPIGPAKQLPKDRPLSTPVVSNSDWPRFAHGCIVNKLRSMSLVEVNTSDDMWYLHFSSAKTNPRLRRAHDNSFGWTACIKDLAVPSVTCDFLDPKGGDFYLLNTEHPTIQWLELLRNGVATGAAGLKAIEVEVMWHTAATAWFRCQDLIERWSRSTSVPAEFKPQIRKDGYPAYYTNMELYSRRTVRA
ncbi:MAG TPA: ATP-binding protein, partial [Phycisphaerales bacterium]|nr:ATP-binding protein [Phycisphaerales bacterium]